MIVKRKFPRISPSCQGRAFTVSRGLLSGVSIGVQRSTFNSCVVSTRYGALRWDERQRFFHLLLFWTRRDLLFHHSGPGSLIRRTGYFLGVRELLGDTSS